jgi:quercetin dioxygenase-like cupin family protein
MKGGHVKSGDCINLETLREEMDVETTYALVKTSNMEVIRMFLPHGKTVEEHSVNGELSVQCLKGHILFSLDGRAQELTEDDWLYLEKEQPFSYSVKSDSILLVTILFTDHK